MNNCQKRPCSSPLQCRAFTLAEVLITLVIIGVIAALTIPTLINTTQKKEYVAGLKKANAVISQAILKIGQNKGYPVGDYSFMEYIDLTDELMKVVSVAKVCNTFTECAGTHKRLNNSSWTILNNRALVTSDGQIFQCAKTSESSVWGISDEDKNNSIIRIMVDVNGQKNPNKMGYDTFLFYIINGKGLIPSGNYSTSDCNKTGNGFMCTARVLKENAINY